MGKQWIRKYTLAICKETLGRVRGKYATMPIPDGEVTLNGPELIAEAVTEKEALITQLKEILDQLARQSQLERKVAEAEQLNTQLKFVPMKIYVR
jgi:C4-type Zn-finger protein